MVLNAGQNAAKCRAKCCKMPAGKYKNTLQWYKHNLVEP